MPFSWNFRRQTTGANDRAILNRLKKRLARSNRMKLRLIETRLLTLINNVNAFHGNERTCDTKPTQLLRRSRTQNISLCFLISISAVILKVMLKLTSISPRDLGESLRRRRRIIRRSAFIYHTFHQSVFYSPYFIPSPQSAVRSPQSVFYTGRHKFIHTHNLLHYYKVGDQASVEVEEVEEQMLIFSSSLTPGRVKGF